MQEIKKGCTFADLIDVIQYAKEGRKGIRDS
jgi:hypothetical protein